MLSDNKKISFRQVAFMFLTITFTPGVRFIPVYVATHAKQAAWLAPFISMFVFIILVFVWNSIYKKNKDRTLMDIYSNITGSFFGKIISVVYLLWVVLLGALYVRYFAIRLVGSVYPNVDISIFMISMLILIVYTYRYGIVVLARMNEIVFVILTVSYYVIFIMLIPNIKIEQLTPVTYRDIMPVTSASMGIIGIYAYFTFFFILGDSINDKEHIKKIGIQTSIFHLFALITIIMGTIGTFGYTVVSRTPHPFLTAVKQISLFNTLEKMESVVVVFWVLSDFMIISFFIICALKILKVLFKLSDTKPLINIYAIFIYLLSLYLTNNVFDLEKLSKNFIIPGNIILGFIIPIVIFVIGKVRQKV